MDRATMATGITPGMLPERRQKIQVTTVKGKVRTGRRASNASAAAAEATAERAHAAKASTKTFLPYGAKK